MIGGDNTTVEAKDSNAPSRQAPRAPWRNVLSDSPTAKRCLARGYSLFNGNVTCLADVKFAMAKKSRWLK